MLLLLLSFVAGVLTVLAPCILPLLPVVIGRSLGAGNQFYRPLVITGSLAVAVVAFTLLLKSSTLLIDIPQAWWSIISGVIIIAFGIITLWPELWERINVSLNLGGRSQQLLQQSSSRGALIGDVLIGLSLGPIFSSCSPTYFIILATVLPQSFATGLVYLIAYALGLSLALLAIAWLGQRLTKRLTFAADSRGWFKRGLGILFILVGIFIFTGTDKKVQTYLLDQGYFDISQVEIQLMHNIELE